MRTHNQDTSVPDFRMAVPNNPTIITTTSTQPHTINTTGKPNRDAIRPTNIPDPTSPIEQVILYPDKNVALPTGSIRRLISTENKGEINSEELADIILVCFNIAKHYNIDIEKELKNKIEINYKRANN